MQHPVVPSSFSSIKLEAYPAHLQQHPAISFDYNYNYHPNQQLLPPPDSNNMAKRALSDSDCEDLFTDTKDSCMTPPGSDAGGGGGGGNVSRKKRRGIIEKRRRDRINNSLSELRRLVPTAFEKQGSAKLEKAEILQMTVDHLKMLHAKGADALVYEPHKFDYYAVGFTECSREVGRYLVAVEGMELNDPLRLRLLSHLQCFAAQRELANKQASASSWGLNPLTPNHSYPIPSLHHLSSSGNSSANSGGLGAPPLQPGTQHPIDGSSPSSHHNYLNSSSSPSNHTISPSMAQDSISNQSLPHGGHMGSHQRTLFPPNHHSHHIPREYSSSLASQHPNGGPMTSSPYGLANHQNYPVQSGKPYRPWGAELAY